MAFFLPVLWLVDPYAHSQNVRVARPLGLRPDRKARDGVRPWRFEPALKDGRPVALQINVEVNFRLYENSSL
ncbi:MAG: energy transducer TonB [Acidobacteriia bacterium]|nr:energy transducer TonB [Terriglobia bacterium]